MDDWKVKLLGDVCTLHRGFDLPTQVRRPGAHPLVSSSGVIDTHDDGRVLGPGVVTGRSGSIGNVFYVEGDFWPLNTTLYVRDFHNNDPRFVHYLLTAFDLRRYAGGTGVPTLNRNDVHSVAVRVPTSVTEQRRIVAILDEAFEAIATAKANTEKNLQNARELFTNRLERVFSERTSGWRRVALESIGSTQTGSTPKSTEPENLGNYLPFVKPGDFKRDGSVDFDNEGLSESGAKKARCVRANSALMVCIGATIGKAGFSERKIATNQQVNAWTPTTETSSKFIYYQMTTGDFQRRVRESAGQATLPIINKSKWSALTVVVPPTLNEQTTIVATLDTLLEESMSLEAIYDRKLAALDELKRSLLHQAFNGGLSP